MIKFGYFTDLHARNDTPEKRTDDFRTSILAKLHEIGEIFKREEVDLILFGGDLGHTPDPTYSLTNAVLKELKSWNKQIVGVVGSHDYFGYQKRTIDRTMMGNMIAAGVITLVDDSYSYLYKHGSSSLNSPAPTIVITGTQHQYDSTDHIERLNHKQEYSNALLQIQLVHCDLYYKPVAWSHILIQDVKTESDLVLSGHIHSGWDEPIKIGETTFFNPGSIARLEKSKTKRIPRVSIIEIEDYKKYSIKDIQLTTALEHPFRDDVEEFESEENTSQDISKLLDFIETTDIEITDVKQLLIEFAKRENYSKEVLEVVFELLEKAKN